jgi:hypothetical protein
MGFGPHSANHNVAEIANEIAIARALSELADRLLAAAVQYPNGHLRARGETELATRHPVSCNRKHRTSGVVGEARRHRHPRATPRPPPRAATRHARA